ncbi:MAG TPA: GNAT family N-acetyltransferase [Chitinophagales bacterium]|nr:GNAT family N-acetyltransferase [Chitinophagales bacterium]
MIRLQQTTSANKDFVELVRLLDAYLAEKDGDEHAFYNQFNNIENLNHVVVAYIKNKPVGCGAVKPFDKTAMEVKRMFTLPAERSKGIAVEVLKELEKWAVELGYERCVLETGKRQTEAVGFYKKCGYHLIPNYGQYAGVVNSLCFEKRITSQH